MICGKFIWYEVEELGCRFRMALFFCPGCKCMHRVDVGPPSRNPNWTFSGTEECPTFSPSILYSQSTHCCHFYVQAGCIKFGMDCTHELRGQTVPVGDLPEGYC